MSDGAPERSCLPHAVVVTYQPDLQTLARMLAALSRQVARVVIVDNGSSSRAGIAALAEANDARFLPLGANLGIAEAQNRGIEQALEDEAGNVLLMDQDTVLPPHAVRTLLADLAVLLEQGVKVGSLGCAYRDSHDGRIAPISRVASSGRRIERVAVDGASGPVEADFVIASGSLLPADVLRQVGLMEAPLFIDLVDMEWGFRASAKGFRHFQCPAAVMEHTLGNGRIRIHSRSIALHAPIRNYYSVRNALFLALRNYVRPAWRIYFVRQALAYTVVYTWKGDRRPTRLGYMLRGLADGLLGRAGAYRPGRISQA
ncbi:glycosyltransferase family 2 protein [Aureimonas populi]|uniref:Glycosyltransferase family 2 protein n=1 Tax=Aureimonas populi TaxID=1701758 RepID=A0ABW5CJM9_9HYPH|nr:glycosyltransferase family 2 protein [Aureimonas populi]